MKVVNYLNTLLNTKIPEDALNQLSETYGIKCTNYKDSLFVLNYDQIKSPKEHAFTEECRSLVIGIKDGSFVALSRAFDRFFNYGEKKVPVKFDTLIAHEKMDGSLVTLWYDSHYTNSWLYRTKSMIMPELPINGWDKTWKELIEASLDYCQDRFTDKLLPDDCSFIFEVTGQENRVVVRYPENRPATLLAIRSNNTGRYWSDEDVDKAALIMGWLRPRQYSFTTISECLEAAKELPNLEEGYVMYHNGKPVQKIKNPAYVAAHHLRGEGLNPKRCLQLVCLGEVDEYLSVFPEEEKLLKPYVNLLDNMMVIIEYTYNKIKNIKDQKEFASWATKEPFAGILFSMRGKGITALDAFNNLTEAAQHRLLTEFL